MPIFTFTTLDDPLAAASAFAGTLAYGINASGQVVGYYTNTTGGGTHGFLYSGGTYTNFDDPDAGNTGQTLAQGIAFVGTVGLNWQVGGFGNFSSLGESDMILRNTSTGGLEVYDINNNQLTSAASVGMVGLDWQIIGTGNFSSVPGETDMMMRNTKTGGLEVYDIANNQITGAAFLGTVGLDWQFAGIAPVHAAGASD